MVRESFSVAIAVVGLAAIVLSACAPSRISGEEFSRIDPEKAWLQIVDPPIEIKSLKVIARADRESYQQIAEVEANGHGSIHYQMPRDDLIFLDRADRSGVRKSVETWRFFDGDEFDYDTIEPVETAFGDGYYVLGRTGKAYCFAAVLWDMAEYDDWGRAKAKLDMFYCSAGAFFPDEATILDFLNSFDDGYLQYDGQGLDPAILKSDKVAVR